MKKLFISLLYLSLLATSLLNTTIMAEDRLTVRVGVYDNAPKYFITEKGQAAGFWADILEHIARQEGWKIEYVPGTWAECLSRLERNEIDIMPDVAYTEQRGRSFDFSAEAVYVSWSRVVTRPRTDIESILDLEGKKVAVLKGSVNFEGPEGIKTLVTSFNVSCTFLEAGSYLQVFEMVKSGEADAGVISKDFANLYLAEYNLASTPIIFQPSSLFFAFTKGASLSPHLVERIDNHIRELKRDNDSVYYQALEKWLGIKPERATVIPLWMIWLLSGIGGLAFLLAAGSIILRYQVRARTRDLAAEIAERKQMTVSLLKTNRALKILSLCNEALIHSTEEQLLLNDICRIIVKEGSYCLAWVGFAEQDQDKAFRPVAQCGDQDDYLATISNARADPAENVSYSLAVLRGQPGVVRNIRDLPGTIKEHSEALKRGFAAALALPLADGGQVFGSLNIYSAEPEAFSEEEVRLLTEMANDLAYGIKSLRSRQERDIARENLKTYLEMAPDGVYICDMSGVFLYGNRRAEEISGYLKEELIGKSFLTLNLISGEYIVKARKQLELNAAGKSTGMEEFELKRKDGTRIWVEISTTPISQRGEYVVMGIVRDVTEHRKMLEKLISSDRLAAVGQLAAGIAHELNNPLTSVIGFAEMLLARKGLPADIRGDLETVHHEAQRTAGVVKGLLTFSRKQTAEKSLLDIHSIIKGVLQLRSYEERVKNIEVNTCFAPDLPEVFGNYAQLQQVVINIVINAEQAILEARNKGKLSVLTERAGNMVRISFSDDGPGISPENLQKLFTPFFTTKAVGKGTGLGLSICYGIITEHGGKIQASSQPGAGATFTIELPCG